MPRVLWVEVSYWLITEANVSVRVCLDKYCDLIGLCAHDLSCFSEVCKALNKNRGLYGRWSELQNAGITSPIGGAPMSGSATAPPISRTDELDWTTTELRKALRSIEWDLDDLEDTIYILFPSIWRIIKFCMNFYSIEAAPTKTVREIYFITMWMNVVIHVDIRLDIRSRTVLESTWNSCKNFEWI